MENRIFDIEKTFNVLIFMFLLGDLSILLLCCPLFYVVDLFLNHYFVLIV